MSSYAWSLPVHGSDADEFDLTGLITELKSTLLEQVTNNNVAIPVLQSIDVLLESAVIEKLDGDDHGNVLEDILNIVSRNPDKLKNVQRIAISAKV